jgi:pimeloyl-ACP methyl ester carboxylesterase
LRRALALTALALALPATADAQSFTTCRGVFETECTTVRVPLDRTGALPGTVNLRVARIPPARGRPPLVYLSGGPGSAGVEELTFVAGIVPELTRRYDMYGFDQRGTGASGLLRCPEVERDLRLRSPHAGEACARRLGPARRHYTTAASVEDLEAIRAALGLERMTLFGVSYGTQLALAYARAHPDRLERMILDSVVDLDDRDPFGLSVFRAIGPTLEALCPARCRGVSADPARDLSQLVAQLRARPLRARVYDARGRGRLRTLGPLAILDLMFDGDFAPPFRAGIPAAVRAALDDDAAPLLRLTEQASQFADLGDPSLFSSARYAAICEETPLPWDATTPIAERTAEMRRRAAALGEAAFFPFDVSTAAGDEIGLCGRWPGVPAPTPPPGTRAPFPAVPTLLLQGGEDIRTPPEASARVASAIPGAQRVVVPGVGHSVFSLDPSSCALRKLVRFAAGRAAGGDCRRVPTNVPAVALPPKTLADVAPIRGVRGRRGRTVAAIAFALDDLAFMLSPGFQAAEGGGLRGGSWRVGLRIVLRRFEAVEGVRLDGGGSEVLRLRVSGRAAAGGRVTIRGRRLLLTGRLGGRRVRVPLAGAVGSTSASLSSHGSWRSIRTPWRPRP